MNEKAVYGLTVTTNVDDDGRYLTKRHEGTLTPLQYAEVLGVLNGTRIAIPVNAMSDDAPMLERFKGIRDDMTVEELRETVANGYFRVRQRPQWNVEVQLLEALGALGAETEKLRSITEELHEERARKAQTGVDPVYGVLLDAMNANEWAVYDYAAESFCTAVHRILDGEDDGRGISNEPWQRLRSRLLARLK